MGRGKFLRAIIMVGLAYWRHFPRTLQQPVSNNIGQGKIHYETTASYYQVIGGYSKVDALSEARHLHVILGSVPLL